MKFHNTGNETTGEATGHARAEWTNDFDVAYSERNILDWMKYLPQDCIETMIRMGWDCST